MTEDVAVAGTHMNGKYRESGRIPAGLMCIVLCLTVLAAVFCACSKDDVEPSVTVSYLTCLTEEGTLPHAGAGFTEGFFIKDGKIFESVGEYYSSAIRTYVPGDSEPGTLYSFDDFKFAEGSVFFDGRYYALTYVNYEAYIFDGNMELVSCVSYDRQGWGLTTDGEYLIASDGSDCLYYMDGEYNDIRTVHVSYDGIPVSNLNELEYIDGYIWANIWRTDVIVVIDPDTGNVIRSIDFTGMTDVSEFGIGEDEYADAVLNGIAYDEESGKIYITGKYYPDIFVFTRK